MAAAAVVGLGDKDLSGRLGFLKSTPFPDQFMFKKALFRLT